VLKTSHFYFPLFILLFSPFSLHAQYEFKGWVVDTNKKPVPSALVSIYKSAKGIDRLFFTTSKPDGSFVISMGEVPPDSIFLRVSSLGYKTLTKSLNSKNNDFTLILEEVDYEFEPIIIEAKKEAFEIKGDSLIFNYELFTESDKENLQSLFNKIPGFNFNELGMITYEGETINAFLINGDNIVGDDYELLTKLLNVGDIDSLMVLKNYNESKLKSNALTTTAVNISTKDSTLNKVNINTKIGVEKKREVGKVGINQLLIKPKVKTVRDLKFYNFQDFEQSPLKQIINQSRNHGYAADLINQQNAVLLSDLIAAVPSKKVVGLKSRSSTHYKMKKSELRLDIGLNAEDQSFSTGSSQVSLQQPSTATPFIRLEQTNNINKQNHAASIEGKLIRDHATKRIRVNLDFGIQAQDIEESNAFIQRFTLLNDTQISADTRRDYTLKRESISGFIRLQSEYDINDRLILRYSSNTASKQTKQQSVTESRLIRPLNQDLNANHVDLTNSLLIHQTEKYGGHKQLGITSKHIKARLNPQSLLLSFEPDELRNNQRINEVQPFIHINKKKSFINSLYLAALFSNKLNTPLLRINIAAEKDVFQRQDYTFSQELRLEHKLPPSTMWFNTPQLVGARAINSGLADVAYLSTYISTSTLKRSHTNGSFLLINYDYRYNSNSLIYKQFIDSDFSSNTYSITSRSTYTSTLSINYHSNLKIKTHNLGFDFFTNQGTTLNELNDSGINEIISNQYTASLHAKDYSNNRLKANMQASVQVNRNRIKNLPTTIFYRSNTKIDIKYDINSKLSFEFTQHILNQNLIDSNWLLLANLKVTHQFKNFEALFQAWNLYNSRRFSEFMPSEQFILEQFEVLRPRTFILSFKKGF
jgi:hypothetical protein